MKSAYRAKKRNSADRKRNRIILISTEGTNKTEENYFKSFSSKTIKIHFANGNQTDPINMAKNLINDYENHQMDASLGDRAFCVVDGDLSLEREEQIIKAEQILKKKNCEMIVSNPCFEIWFLCHFEYSTRQYSSSSQAIKKLQDFLPSYRKNMTGIKEQLEEYTFEAIQNAAKLDVHNNSVGHKKHSHECQPSTEASIVLKSILGID